MKRLLPFLVAIFALLGSRGSQAQTPLSNLVVTVGTTINTGGTNWSYLLIGSPQSQLVAGKNFAVYSKPGSPTNPVSFTLRTNLVLQTDPAAINALLNQSAVLGDNLTALENSLKGLLHTVPGITNLTLPQKIATAFQVAGSDAQAAQVLAFLAHVHPGLVLCEGLGFTESITGITTYEVRDVNLATSAAGEVVGRVTLDPNAPNLLPAPGLPFQVITNAPSDHLRIRLRWGTPDELRRLSLLSYGFNLWRISSNAFITAGYTTNHPPTMPQQLYANPNFTNVNTAAVMASKDYSTNTVNTGGGGADDPTDLITYFFSDNNGHSLGNVEWPSNYTIPPGYLVPPFNDGDTFYYFVTARDVLGRDGNVSPAGWGRAYRRLPPQPPSNVRVQNSYKVLSNGNPPVNQQCLSISWQQNLNATDHITEYWVYRWPNPAMAHTSDMMPSNNLIQVVLQVPGTNNSYLDNGAGAPLTPGASNFWYTVRAVSQTAGGPLLSPQSTAAWGVLRERVGPDGTSGDIIGSCGAPMVIFQNFNTNTLPGSPDLYHYYYRLTCQRRDAGIASVQFLATNLLGGVDILGPFYFPPDGDTVSADYSTSLGVNSIACIVTTVYGRVSAPAPASFAFLPLLGQQVEAVFYAGQLLLTALSSADPLLAEGGTNGQVCFSASGVTAYADGTVRLQFPETNRVPLLIEVFETATNTSGLGGYWVDVAVALPDTNGFYWVSYPACLVKPLPAFRGCLVDLPGDGFCAEHISRAGGRIAPILGRFKLTPRSHEYRFYRRANDGPLTLVTQGGAVYDTNDPSRLILVTDRAMPPSAARLCYYVQLLDENGNGGPMTFLGCKEVKPETLPRPVLAEPHAAGDSNNPLVLLNWFCPTAGVYRFEVLIQRDDLRGSGQPSGVKSIQLHLAKSHNPVARYYGLSVHLSELAQFDEAQLTPPISADFGPGPQFTLTAGLLTNVLYDISVAPVDDQGNVGDSSASEVWKFMWKATNGLPEVPWPARPTPTIDSLGFDDYTPPTVSPAFRPRVQAVLQNGPGLDQVYPVGIRIGQFLGVSATTNVATTNYAGLPTLQYVPPNGITATAYFPDPNGFVFQRQSQDPTRDGQPLLPIVVYRQQVTNAQFPRVSGNVAQVTPLLESIAYSTNAGPGFPPVTIFDKLVALGGEHDQANNTNGTFLYLRDQQPVILGASYQYFVVRLNTQREISEIIPAGTVTLPVNVPTSP